MEDQKWEDLSWDGSAEGKAGRVDKGTVEADWVREGRDRDWEAEGRGKTGAQACKREQRHPVTEQEGVPDSQGRLQIKSGGAVPNQIQDTVP